MGQGVNEVGGEGAVGGKEGGDAHFVKGVGGEDEGVDAEGGEVGREGC